MERIIRNVLIVGGILTLILAFGFYTLQDWATMLWATVDSPLSYRFIASMAAAIAAAMLWIGITGNLHFMRAGAINLAVMFGGKAIFLGLNPSLLNDAELLLPSGAYIGICVAFCVFNIWLFFWARRFPAPDPQPLPTGVRISYVIFILALLAVGTSLVMQIPNILPWPLPPVTSILFGWMFLGDAFYFAYALVKPQWTNGEAQLWSFLAYDLVLIVPFLNKLPTINPEFFMPMIAYLGVLFFSGAVAIYYLFINPTTRFVARRSEAEVNASAFELIYE